MDRITKGIEDIKAGWQRMEKTKRIRLIAVVSVVLIGIISLTYFTQRTEYKVLFKELDAADAGAIVEDIEAKGMNYKLEDNGTTILVDKDELDHYRIELAVDGLLPSSSTGFEIFDNASMMATDDDRAIMYQRAVAGELERAITALDNVKSAKVLLNIPEDSVFQNPEYRREASASVILEMKTSNLPSAQTIQGIASLVAGAVDNLPTDNIEIVDTKGRLLSTSFGGDYGGANVVTEHQRIRQSIENELEQKVVSLLAPMFGYENVHVAVNTDLNFDAIEREEIRYESSNPNGNGRGYIRSQSESVSGSDALSERTQRGVLDGNAVNETIDEAENNDESSYTHSTNYELDSITSHIIEAPGTIEKVTASIIIRGYEEPGRETALVRLVENAIGVVEEPDNRFGTEAVQIVFDPIQEEPESPLVPGLGLDLWEEIKSVLAEHGWFIAGVLLGILLLMGIVRFIRNRQIQAAEEEIEEFAFEELTTAKEVEEKEEVIDKEIEQKMLEHQMTNEKEDLVRKHAKENPELAAELIKIWLKESNR